MFNNSFSLNEVQGTSDITNFRMISTIESCEVRLYRGVKSYILGLFSSFNLLASLIKMEVVGSLCKFTEHLPWIPSENSHQGKLHVM